MGKGHIVAAALAAGFLLTGCATTKSEAGPQAKAPVKAEVEKPWLDIDYRCCTGQ